jgi:hypothetical protein
MLLLPVVNHNNFGPALILLIISTNLLLLPTCTAVVSQLAGCYPGGTTCEYLTGPSAYESQLVTRKTASCPEGDPTQVLLECETRSKYNGPYHYY